MIFAGTGSLFGQNVPVGYTLPDITLSPDHRYGITVPMLDAYLQGTLKDKDVQNSVVEVKTGRVLGAIQSDAAFDHMNHDEIVPSWWTADDSMVFWQVDGKWGFNTEILIKLEDGKIKWQVDVLNLLQQEMLKRTRAATPKKYADVKKENADDGSWFRDGFAVDCVLDSKEGPMKFPLLFHIFLTSNPKGFEYATNVDSRMTVEVNKDGMIKVDDFHLGKDTPSRNWE